MFFVTKLTKLTFYRLIASNVEWIKSFYWPSWLCVCSFVCVRPYIWITSNNWNWNWNLYWQLKQTIPDIRLQSLRKIIEQVCCQAYFECKHPLGNQINYQRCKCVWVYNVTDTKFIISLRIAWKNNEESSCLVYQKNLNNVGSIPRNINSSSQERQ